MPPFLYNLALRRHLAARYFYKFQSATKDAAVSPWPVSCSQTERYSQAIGGRKTVMPSKYMRFL